MKTLNQLYNNSCKPAYKLYKKITNNITLIDNFFENFDNARDFFISRENWKCISYQDHSKPGNESFFPSWVGKSLMEKYISDNKIIENKYSYEVVCNHFYNQSNYSWSIANSSYYPHFDDIERKGMLQYICLINLNLTPVSTKFYTFKNTQYISEETEEEYINYIKFIENEIKKYYNKTNITKNEIKIFLNKKKYSKIKLLGKVTYNPNQAIVYPANILHAPNLTEEFFENNPRVLLRIAFDQKIAKNKNFNYK